MDQHSRIAKPATKAAARKTPARRAPALPKLHTLVSSAKSAGQAAAKAAEPLMATMKREEPKTIAKMALAALTPQLINAGLRFAMRNPVIALAGLGLGAVIATNGGEPESS